jgi:hypothetical protein
MDAIFRFAFNLAETPGRRKTAQAMYAGMACSGLCLFYDFFNHPIPGPTLGATSKGFRKSPSTFLADVTRPGFSHGLDFHRS